jgi:hypothetical protein
MPHSSRGHISRLAGAEGFEPSMRDPKSRALPLGHAPSLAHTAVPSAFGPSRASPPLAVHDCEGPATWRAAAPERCSTCSAIAEAAADRRSFSGGARGEPLPQGVARQPRRKQLVYTRGVESDKPPSPLRPSSGGRPRGFGEPGTPAAPSTAGTRTASRLRRSRAGRGEAAGRLVSGAPIPLASRFASPPHSSPTCTATRPPTGRPSRPRRARTSWNRSRSSPPARRRPLPRDA